MAPLCDVQGLILRSYGMDCAAFFLLRVETAAAARRSLGTLPITPATLWDQKPPYCVNVGLTFEGLAALGVAADSLKSFPEEFATGAFARCAEVGRCGLLFAGEVGVRTRATGSARTRAVVHPGR